MNTSEGDDRLSEDARAAIDALAEEWRTELEIRANIYADARGANLVSRSDVVASAESSSWKRLPKSRRSIDKLTPIVVAASAITAIAVITVIAQAMGTPNSIIPLIAAISITIFVINYQREQRTESVPERALLVTEVIDQWSDVERFMRGFAPLEDDDGKSPVSLGTIFRHYERRAPVSRETMEQLHSLLDTRNKLVHAHSEEVSDDELRAAIRVAKDVKRELQRVRDWGLEQ
ncbi:hypothetical protein KBZ10_10445 [Streptomyces sp. F63]|uniref:hypothetical protein n=1 Tax=Streptomyces sp. F63 TaxID=2824887 RepID=UPI001B37D3B8|nr:hypothetical protein [Streptomyces sp. F63]MBQ0984928.1 hypothetical protein [Streptomyces sp. F63]